jgi:hypothetical protein
VQCAAGMHHTKAPPLLHNIIHSSARLGTLATQWTTSVASMLPLRQLLPRPSPRRALRCNPCCAAARSERRAQIRAGIKPSPGVHVAWVSPAGPRADPPSPCATRCAAPELWRHREPPLAAHAHALHTDVPTADDLPNKGGRTPKQLLRLTVPTCSSTARVHGLQT